MEDRRRASFLSRNTACVLMCCWMFCSQRTSAQGRFTVVAKTGDAAPGLNDTFGDVVGTATLVQIAAVPVAIAAAPRVGVAIALLCVAFFLLPQPKPRYKPGEEPSTEEKLEE